MTIKNRLAKLEKRADETPAQRIEIIEIHKTYDDGHTEIETREVNYDNQEPITAA